MTDFNNLREILETIRIGVGGGIVSASWNGELLQVVHARPELKSGKWPFNMVFDTESDFEPERLTEIIKTFSVESKKYYEAS